MTQRVEDEVLAKLREIAEAKLGIDAGQVVPGTALADAGIDSFQLIELVFLAEEAFGISIPLEGTKVRTVDDVVAVVVSRLDAEAQVDPA